MNTPNNERIGKGPPPLPAVPPPLPGEVQNVLSTSRERLRDAAKPASVLPEAVQESYREAIAALRALEQKGGKTTELFPTMDVEGIYGRLRTLFAHLENITRVSESDRENSVTQYVALFCADRAAMQEAMETSRGDCRELRRLWDDAAHRLETFLSEYADVRFFYPQRLNDISDNRHYRITRRVRGPQYGRVTRVVLPYVTRNADESKASSAQLEIEDNTI